MEMGEIIEWARDASTLHFTPEVQSLIAEIDEFKGATLGDREVENLRASIRIPAPPKRDDTA